MVWFFTLNIFTSWVLFFKEVSGKAECNCRVSNHMLSLTPVLGCPFLFWWPLMGEGRNVLLYVLSRYVEKPLYLSRNSLQHWEFSFVLEITTILPLKELWKVVKVQPCLFCHPHEVSNRTTVTKGPAWAGGIETASAWGFAFLHPSCLKPSFKSADLRPNEKRGWLLSNMKFNFEYLFPQQPIER